jgi:dienelactone hydrolase
MKNRYRQNETWVQNRFVDQYGIEAFMKNANMGLEEKGFKHVDIMRASARMTCLRSMPKAWTIVAQQQEQLAKEAEEKAHGATAGAFYHRAALYYGKAQLYYHKDDEKKIDMYNDCIRCYEKAMKYFDYTIEKVVLPFGEHKLYGILHIPKDIKEPLPAVLANPGMDMIKEDYPNLSDNFIIKRNMVGLVIDGPGFGETRARGCRLTLDNYQQAGKLFIDYLCSRPEVNADQIGVLGASLGSYYAPLVASYDSRVKGIATLLGAFTSFELLMHSVQPGCRNKFKYMTGVYDDDEFDTMVEQMSLANIADKIKVPILASSGEFDEMCPPEMTMGFFKMLNCPKEVWILEDEHHSCAGMYHELYAWALDWLRDVLTKGLPADHAVKKWIPSRR